MKYTKLDGIGPIDNRPSNTLKKEEEKKKTQDTSVSSVGG